jgi:hypothetical protein
MKDSLELRLDNVSHAYCSDWAHGECVYAPDLSHVSRVTHHQIVHSWAIQGHILAQTLGESSWAPILESIKLKLRNLT